MKNKYSIVKLNADFFKRHSEDSEILCKPNRPHLVMLVSINKLTFAIPFRTSAHRPKLGGIPHCYFFSSSGRQELSSEGKVPALDFAKSVIVTEDDIGSTARIDQNEFKELHDNFLKIEAKFKDYLHHYIFSIKNSVNLDAPEIRFSSLQYFKEALLKIEF